MMTLATFIQHIMLFKALSVYLLVQAPRSQYFRKKVGEVCVGGHHPPDLTDAAILTYSV